MKMKNPVSQLKKIALPGLVMTFCLLVQIQTNFAQSSKPAATPTPNPYELTTEDIEKAVKNGKSSSAFNLDLAMGDEELKKGNYQSALNDFTLYIESHPNDDVGYAKRSITYRKLKDFEKSIIDAEKALTINPQNTEALNMRGIYKNSQKNYDSAIADFTQIIKLDPKFEVAYINRAISYNNQKKFTEAAEDYTRAIWLDPKNANLFFGRGRIYVSQNLKEKAIFDFNKSIELKPDFSAAKFALENIQSSTGAKDSTKTAEITSPAETRADNVCIYGIKDRYLKDETNFQ